MKEFPGKRALARLSIADIEDMVNRIDTLDDAVLAGLNGDGRAGVRALARKLVRSRERDRAERDRLAALAAAKNELDIGIQFSRFNGFTRGFQHAFGTCAPPRGKPADFIPFHVSSSF